MLALWSTVAAMAQDCDPDSAGWTCTQTAIYQAQTLIPLGVAIRYDATLGEVFLVIELKDNDTDAMANHTLQASAHSCDDADCISFTNLTGLEDLVHSVTTGDPISPSFTIEHSAGTHLHVIGSQDDGGIGCSGDLLSQESVWADDLDTNNRNLTLRSTCDATTYGDPLIIDVGATYHACWTDKPPLQDEQVMCAERAFGSTTTWGTPDTVVSSSAYSDHSDLRISGSGHRMLIFHDEDSGAIAVEDLDAVTPTQVDIPVGVAASPNWPGLTNPSGAFKAIFFDVNDSNHHGLGFQSNCSSGCPTSSANWSATPGTMFTQTNVASNGIEHSDFQAASDGSLHAVWMQHDNTGDARWAYYSWHCPSDGGSWHTPVKIWDGSSDSPSHTQQLVGLGRPHLDLDNANHVAHVAFPVLDKKDDATDGSVVWARRTWDCSP